VTKSKGQINIVNSVNCFPESHTTLRITQKDLRTKGDKVADSVLITSVSEFVHDIHILVKVTDCTLYENEGTYTSLDTFCLKAYNMLYIIVGSNQRMQFTRDVQYVLYKKAFMIILPKPDNANQKVTSIVVDRRVS
jgi:hypothetical protein